MEPTDETFEKGQSRKRRATKFEEKVVDFLRLLKFDDVEGARDNFRINGVQVDACGGWDGTLLVFECKHSSIKKPQNARNAISQIRGDMSVLIEGFKRHPTYSKYTDFKFLVITKNIPNRREDLEFAKEKPEIYLCNENFLEYYTKLHSEIEEYAKYDLLGELFIKPSKHNVITIPSFRTVFPRKKIALYSFLIDPHCLLETTYVARRESARQRNYQRIIKGDRVRRIAKFITDGGFFANNILIAFSGPNVKFKRREGHQGRISPEWPFPNLELGILEFPKNYRSCWIIDGQHRLYAFAKLNEVGNNVPVVAIQNLELKDEEYLAQQGNLFLEINKNQKPVPPELVWDLYGDMIPNEVDGIISNIVKRLNSDLDSPLYHLIYVPSLGIKKRKQDKISMTSVCTSLKKRKLVNPTSQGRGKNPYYFTDYVTTTDKLTIGLKKFFSELKSQLPESWDLGSKGFIRQDGGTSVLIGLFERIVDRVMRESDRAPTDEEFAKYLRPLSRLFNERYNSPDKLKNLRLKCANEAGKEVVLQEFTLWIRSSLNDNQFGGLIKDTSTDRFVVLEERARGFMNSVMVANEGDEWIKNIDKEIFKYIEARYKQNHGMGESKINELYTECTLGHCFNIIQTKKEYFYPLLMDSEGTDPFSSNKEVEVALSLISEGRRKVHKGGGSNLTPSEEAILYGYLDKLETCLSEQLVK